MIPHPTCRRAGAVILALALSGGLPALANAAPTVSVSGAWHAPLLVRQTQAARFGGLSSRLRATIVRSLVHSGLRDQTVTDPTKLAFPVPSNATGAQQQTVTTAFTDDPKQNVFASLNTSTYAASGMQSGYLEAFTLPIGSGNDTVLVDYLATIYGSDAQANARTAGNAQFFSSHSLPVDSCGSSCYVAGAPLTGSDGRTLLFTYTTWSSDNVVAELGLFVYQDVETANNSAFAAILQNVDGLATSAVPVQAAQTQSALAIVDFEVVRSVKGKITVVHKLKSGQAGVFIADLQVPNPNDTVQAQVTFTVGKKTVGPLVLGNPQTASDGSLLVGAGHKFKVKKATSVVAHLVVQDGSQQATKDLKFKVTP